MEPREHPPAIRAQYEYVRAELEGNLLPYPREVKALLSDHLICVTSRYSRLTVKTRRCCGQVLFTIEGHIPLQFRGKSFLLAITLRIPEAYPVSPPFAFLPTPPIGRSFKNPHTHIDVNGVVQVPYLQRWIFPGSTLVGLVDDMTTHFSLDPPVRKVTPHVPPPLLDSPSCNPSTQPSH